jgi:hypothetical protein
VELDPPLAWRSGAPDSYGSATLVGQVDGNGQVIGGRVLLRGLPGHDPCRGCPADTNDCKDIEPPTDRRCLRSIRLPPGRGPQIAHRRPTPAIRPTPVARRRFG